MLQRLSNNYDKACSPNFQLRLHSPNFQLRLHYVQIITLVLQNLGNYKGLLHKALIDLTPIWPLISASNYPFHKFIHGLTPK